MTTRVAASRKSPSRRKAPALSATLDRYSLWVFVAFGFAVLVAFWPTYFSRLTDQPTYHPHTHGIVMSLWCALLVVQASLIRSGNRRLHKLLGKLSWLLVPLMVLATLNFLSFRVHGARSFNPSGLYFVSLIVNAIVAFLILFGLAMYHRRNPAVHGRYMLSTIFPLFTPVTDRIIAVHFPSIVPLVPVIGGTPVLPVAGFLLADALLIGLSVWDWKKNGRMIVFPIALFVLVMYHVSVLTFYNLSSWNQFALWFAGLPLS